MSRYVIPQDDPQCIVSAGWDNPLSTFYAQVHDADGECLYWIGGDYDALPTVEALQEALGAIATIPDALGMLLRRDQRDAQPPTPLQQTMRVLAKGEPPPGANS